MSDTKNIERLFQEKFKEFEAVPSPKVWSSIEAELHKTKKRKVLPMWFKISGAAALLLLSTFIGWEIGEKPSQTIPNEKVVHQQKNSEDQLQKSSSVANSNASDSNVSKTEKTTINHQNTNTDFHKNDVKNGIVESKNKIEKTKNSNFENSVVKKEENSSETSNSIASDKRTIAETSKKTAKNKKAPFLTISKNNSKIASSRKNSKSDGQGRIFKNNTQNNSPILNSKTAIVSNQDQTTRTARLETSTTENIKNDTVKVAEKAPNALEELAKQNEKTLVADAKINKWQVSSNISPIYYNSASDGSPLSKEFADNGKDYEKNMSYGIGIQYALSKKWSVRSGVNKLTLGYNTHDIVYYAGLHDPEKAYTNPNAYHTKGSLIIVEDNSAANIISLDHVSGKKPGYMNHKMGYIEVPVEISYELLDKKFGIEIMGGLSTLFLNENNLSVISEGISTKMGSAENLNPVSFASTVGLGFKYQFWKSFQANVAPKFKYQLNTFSTNEGGFKPYFIGIYSGISFSF